MSYPIEFKVILLRRKISMKIPTHNSVDNFCFRWTTVESYKYNNVPVKQCNSHKQPINVLQFMCLQFIIHNNVWIITRWRLRIRYRWIYYSVPCGSADYDDFSRVTMHSRCVGVTVRIIIRYSSLFPESCKIIYSVLRVYVFTRTRLSKRSSYSWSVGDSLTVFWLLTVFVIASTHIRRKIILY